MIRCEYCNAPMLSITQVCPNCKREQPPYPPQLPGGGGKSYSRWALILVLHGIFFLGLGIAMFIQTPISDASAYTYGSPDSYLKSSTGAAQYLGGPDFPIYPGYGYLIFFGGIGVILLLWALISYNRGRRIDKVNATLLRAIERNGG